MTTNDDVRRIALALPETSETEERFGFSVRNGSKQRGIVWLWNERVDPRKPKVPNPEVLALRAANEEEKQALLALNDPKFFTEPHYNGYPAILVRLPLIEPDELAELIEDSWRCQAHPKLIAEWERRGRDSNPR